MSNSALVLWLATEQQKGPTMNQQQRTRTDRLMAVLFWLGVALFVAGGVIWRLTGHTPSGIMFSAVVTITGARFYRLHRTS
jgi:hypothetical protein